MHQTSKNYIRSVYIIQELIISTTHQSDIVQRTYRAAVKQ